MKRVIFLILMAMLAAPGVAEKGKSIMFGDQDPLYQERSIASETDQQAAECKALKKRIDSLSLRPLSRNAAIQRYRLECTQNYDEPASSLGP